MLFWFMALFFIFIFGLSVGSFLNVLIYRLPKDLTLFGRSFCPKCRQRIVWYDNLPLVSFILLRGKCRKCRSPISIQYPLMELLTGVFFVLSFLFLANNHDSGFIIDDLGFWMTVFYTFWIISAFLAILAIDLKHQIIPDQMVFSTVVIVLVYRIYNSLIPISHYLLSAIIACLFFYFLHKITKGKGMGLGDVKLVFLMGLILGFPKIVLALYLAFLTGALGGVILILAGKKRFGQKIPFGPFLALATLVSLFWGNEMIKWLTARLL